MGSYTKKKLVANINPPYSPGGSGTVDTVYQAELTIPTADVLTLNATPITIVAAPGVGKYIEIVSGSAIIETYGGSPYATNTNLALLVDTATFRAGISSNILTSTVARTVYITKDTGGSSTDTQLIVNKALKVTVLTGNPTNAGTGSDIKIKVLYRIVTV